VRLVVCLVWLACASATVAGAYSLGDLDYTPGHGLRVGQTGLTLGGYGSLDFTRNDGGPAELTLEALSLFVSWDPIERLHLFSEIEGEDLLTVDDYGHGGVTEGDFVVERLYGDFAATDWLNFRVGKFLTPIGRWNVIHAQPLVWTTSRPLVTIRPFDPNTTGAMVFGNVFPDDAVATYQLYGQFTDQFAPEPTPQRASRGVGGRIDWSAMWGWSIGGSYEAFQHDGDWRQLSGVDALWVHGRVELMGEFAYVVAQHGSNDWGLYLQAAIETIPHVYVVTRYEYFDPKAPEPAVNLGVAGLAWKPWDPLILKVEYLFADHRTAQSPPGVKSSVAVLF
jgi:hypothetical protein